MTNSIFPKVGVWRSIHIPPRPYTIELHRNDHVLYLEWQDHGIPGGEPCHLLSVRVPSHDLDGLFRFNNLLDWLADYGSADGRDPSPEEVISVIAGLGFTRYQDSVPA